MYLKPSIYTDLATDLLDNKDEPLVEIQPGMHFAAKYLNMAAREKQEIRQTGYSNI
jgi:hypothetical protein